MLCQILIGRRATLPTSSAPTAVAQATGLLSEGVQERLATTFTTTSLPVPSTCWSLGRGRRLVRLDEAVGLLGTWQGCLVVLWRRSLGVVVVLVIDFVGLWDWLVVSVVEA